MKGIRRDNWVQDEMEMFNAVGKLGDAEITVKIIAKDAEQAWTYLNLFYPNWEKTKLEPFSVVVVNEEI